MSDYIMALTTTESRAEADAIARSLVEKELAACVQVVGPINSTYRWKGRIENAKEWLCLIKTRGEVYPRLERAILEMHSYETPEITALPIAAGSSGYLSWLQEQIGGNGE